MLGHRIAPILTAAMIVIPGTGARAGEYPTPVIVDYVIGCMASNGQTQDIMRRCACSIDVISSIIPYDAYEQAETVVRMQQITGDQASLFRNARMLKAKVDSLRLAQVEADFRCF